jgi:hypothetical protein
VATLPTFSRRAINAIVAQARGDFAVYRYRVGRLRQGTRYMLFDRSPEGRWSHSPRTSYHECFCPEDKEAAAAPYSSDFLAVAGKGSLLGDLRDRGALDWEAIRGTGERYCTDSAEHALRVCLFWLKELHGVRIEREQVVSDLFGD